VNGNAVAYLPDSAKVTSDTDIIFHISDPENAARSYWVLMGAVTQPDGSTVPGSGGPDSGGGAWMHLNQGYAYLIGALPWLTSSLVTVASEGTTILVQAYPATAAAPETARVMLVKNPSAGT
jgi:hypothetical protein